MKSAGENGAGLARLLNVSWARESMALMKGAGNFVPVFAMLIGAMNAATAGDCRDTLR